MLELALLSGIDNLQKKITALYLAALQKHNSIKYG